MTMTPVIVLSTVGSSFDVVPLARDLVERRLAACVNIVAKMRSIYRWKEKIDDETEQLLIIKTIEEKVDPLREALFASHPYEVPEFVVIRMDHLSDAYRVWLVGATTE
jgi:periplasmic divalent cation tolerance protein